MKYSRLMTRSCEVVQILVTTMVTDGAYVEGQA